MFLSFILGHQMCKMKFTLRFLTIGLQMMLGKKNNLKLTPNLNEYININCRRTSFDHQKFIIIVCEWLSLFQLL